MKKLIFFAFFLSFGFALAQEKRLTLDEYLSIVKSYHPVALQAGIGVDRAFYLRREAIGAFDPKLEIAQEQKVFNGTNYYDYFMPQVKVPLWYGMDLKGSYTTYTGNFVNPDNKVPGEGLGFLGLSVPLGRGLIIDERRAALKQANLFQTMAANEREQILNNLFVDATSSYVQWLNNWLNTEIYRQAVDLAKVRAEGVKMLFKYGDRPAIDTLEALILLQSRQQKLSDYETKLITSKNDLASFLWLENVSPIDPEQLNISPDLEVLSLSLPDSLLKEDASVIISSNPEIKNYGLKIRQLDVERRLKLDQIKPALNVNLGLLNSGRNIFNNMNFAWLQNNQKFGFTLSMPLTFTKQRAAYSLAKLKLKDAEYTFSEKKNLTAVKWENYKNDLQNLDNQLKLYRTIVDNSFNLLKGEEIKFEAGESSLFLVNTREQKLLEVREKANEISAKRIQVIQYLKFIANLMAVN
jgi:outer membrane protein TolC